MKEMKEVVQRERGGEKTEEEMERECVFVCVCVCQCLLEEGLQSPCRAKAASLFFNFFFLTPPKLLSRWIPLLSPLIIHLSLLKGSQAYWIL